MRKFVDLHTHSTASDGSLSPAEVVRLADRRRLAAVALTDHDTVAGLAEAGAAAAELGKLGFVAGVEFSARPISGTLHILGLGIDPEAPSVAGLAERLRRARRQRNPRIVARLRELGLDIDVADVRRAAGAGEDDESAVIGRPHIARALVARGLAADPQEAFRRYLARGAPAYVERERPQPAETIAGIRDGGGLAIAAHPVHWNCDNRAQIERVLRSLVRMGLDGVEVYHPDHTPQQTRTYLELARRLGLAVTGGSDFHGAPKPDVQLGRPKVPVAAVGQDLLDDLLARSRGGRQAPG